MDTSNWRSTQGSSGAVGDSVESGDWRAQLTVDSRRRIVNKIMDTLKRHLPFSGHEGLQELKKMAVNFEEKIYTAATSQSDYLRKISLKMLVMETKSQNPMPDAMLANFAANSINHSDPGSQVIAQANNQGQQLPIPVPTQSCSNRTADDVNPSALPPGNGLPQSTMANVVGQNPNLQNIQNMSGVQQGSVGNAMGPNSFASQRQIPGRQQIARKQQQLVMDTSNGRSNQGPRGAVGDSVESGDWRAQLTADSRQRIVNKIMDTLKRHLPFCGQEELKNLAVKFEEKIYTTVTSQFDYLRKISLKMLAMETRSQNPMPDAMQADSDANSINPSDPGSQIMPQVNNQGQQLRITVPYNHAQPGQQNSKISCI